MKCPSPPNGWSSCGRSPHGERGLKFALLGSGEAAEESLPPRGAWIEILTTYPDSLFFDSRSPHGERGLKYTELRDKDLLLGRSPHGERGLK